ncbi:MAG: putative transcriptional regulator [Candidatus Nitrosomirales archaeon]
MAQLKRAYFDIVANLLEALSDEPSNKTNLASKANLDTRATHRYLNLILKTKLIYMDDANELRITSKGKDFLEEYRKLKLFLEA